MIINSFYSLTSMKQSRMKTFTKKLILINRWRQAWSLWSTALSIKWMICRWGWVKDTGIQIKIFAVASSSSLSLDSTQLRKTQWQQWVMTSKWKTKMAMKVFKAVSITAYGRAQLKDPFNSRWRMKDCKNLRRCMLSYSSSSRESPKQINDV